MGDHAPNDCQPYLERLVSTHTDRQIAVPTMEDGNITISQGKKATSYAAIPTLGAKPGGASGGNNKRTKKSAYDEHPDRAAKRAAKLAKQVQVRVPVFSRNESIRDVQLRQMHLTWRWSSSR